MIVPLSLAWLGVEPGHLLLIALVALLLFGKRLPDVGRSLGRGIAEFKKGLHDVSDELNRSDAEREAPKKKLRPPSPDDDETPEQMASTPRDAAGTKPEEHE